MYALSFAPNTCAAIEEPVMEITTTRVIKIQMLTFLLGSTGSSIVVAEEIEHETVAKFSMVKARKFRTCIQFFNHDMLPVHVAFARRESFGYGCVIVTLMA